MKRCWPRCRLRLRDRLCARRVATRLRPSACSGCCNWRHASLARPHHAATPRPSIRTVLRSAQCCCLSSSTYAYYCTCHSGANRALVASLRHVHELQPRRMTNSSNSITIAPVEAFVKYGLNTTCSEKNDIYLFQPCIDLNNLWQAAVQSKE